MRISAAQIEIMIANYTRILRANHSVEPYVVVLTKNVDPRTVQNRLTLKCKPTEGVLCQPCWVRVWETGLGLRSGSGLGVGLGFTLHPPDPSVSHMPTARAERPDRQHGWRVRFCSTWCVERDAGRVRDSEPAALTRRIGRPRRSARGCKDEDTLLLRPVRMCDRAGLRRRGRLAAQRRARDGEFPVVHQPAVPLPGVVHAVHAGCIDGPGGTAKT